MPVPEEQTPQRLISPWTSKERFQAVDGSTFFQWHPQRDDTLNLDEGNIDLSICSGCHFFREYDRRCINLGKSGTVLRVINHRICITFLQNLQKSI